LANIIGIIRKPNFNRNWFKKKSKNSPPQKRKGLRRIGIKKKEALWESLS